MSEYVPGALYRATYQGKRITVCYADHESHAPWQITGAEWAHLEMEWVADGDLSDISGPLVVIDPDDTADVQRLADTLRLNDSGNLAALLRTPTEPPKPAEPKAFGAVVEDANGTRWVRIATDAVPRSPAWLCREDHRFRPWDGINVVRVLSEGVQ